MKDRHKFYVVGEENRTYSRRSETLKSLRFLASADGRAFATRLDSRQSGKAPAGPGAEVILIEQVSSITRLEAANRQLCAAIRMFFADDDAVAVHTLACAAREIYDAHCSKADPTRALGNAKESDPDRGDKGLWDTLNEPRNFFEHPENDLTDQIAFSDEMNDFLLFAASNDCSTLCAPNQPVEVQIYATWFLAIYTYSEQSIAPADLNRLYEVDRIATMLSEWFPGIRKASRIDQKRLGAFLMEGVLAGRL
jgi:hypothetical protein